MSINKPRDILWKIKLWKIKSISKIVFILMNILLLNPQNANSQITNPDIWIKDKQQWIILTKQRLLDFVNNNPVVFVLVRNHIQDGDLFWLRYVAKTILEQPWMFEDFVNFNKSSLEQYGLNSQMDIDKFFEVISYLDLDKFENFFAMFNLYLWKQFGLFFLLNWNPNILIDWYVYTCSAEDLSIFEQIWIINSAKDESKPEILVYYNDMDGNLWYYSQRTNTVFINGYWITNIANLYWLDQDGMNALTYSTLVNELLHYFFDKYANKTKLNNILNRQFEYDFYWKTTTVTVNERNTQEHWSNYFSLKTWSVWYYLVTNSLVGLLHNKNSYHWYWYTVYIFNSIVNEAISGNWDGSLSDLLLKNWIDINNIQYEQIHEVSKILIEYFNKLTLTYNWQSMSFWEYCVIRFEEIDDLQHNIIYIFSE